MSAPAPHLALVPPAPPRPVQIVPKQGPITAERLRRVAIVAALTGAALPPVAALLGAILGNWRFPIFALCFAILLPCAALVLGLELLVNRTLADLRACLLGLLALLGCLLLFKPASNASVEIFVATRQSALDRLAMDARAFYMAQQTLGADGPSAYLATVNRFAASAADIGVSIAWVQPAEVGLRINGFDGNEIVHLWPGAEPTCPGATVQFLGGGWFRERCPHPPSYDD